MYVYTLEQALARGYNSGLYTTAVPGAEFIAILDFTMWSRWACIDCFFTEVRSGQKLLLTARYRRLESGLLGYTPEDAQIDFSQRGLCGGIYRVATHKSTFGRPTWASAELLAR